MRMKLPNYEKAIIAKKKITGYLLSFSHRDGRGKAMFFSRLGFSVDRWEELAIALRRHAEENEVNHKEKTQFGIRYIIEGNLSAPNGKNARIFSVWFIETNEQIPRLVTAYPLKRSRQ